MGAIPKTIDEADETASPYPPIIPNAETIAAIEDSIAGRNMTSFATFEEWKADFEKTLNEEG
ncbi:hypothetical protein FACS1894205_3340 [Alphaproteobacteria bacterium]|nr:hypothetical protein FACS1894205_3340 [Alphaproteobacteria bacterium]